MTYPLLTPSTWRSTHHTPSQPSSDHSAQYLTACPTGSHSKMQKYRTERISRGGMRRKKTPVVQKVLKMLDGAGGTGKKGAIAVPEPGSQRSEAHAKEGRACVTYAYLYRGTGCTFPWRQTCARSSGRCVTET
jgi:hypothetical protein